MKDCKGIILFLGALCTLAILNCQWVKSCGAPAAEYFSATMWSWTVSLSAILFLPYILTGKIWPTIGCIAVYYVTMLSNLLYLRNFGTWIPIESYMLIDNLTDFMPAVADSMEATDILAPILIVIMALAGRSGGAKTLNYRIYCLLCMLSISVTTYMFANPVPINTQLAMLRTSHNENALAVSRYSLPIVLTFDASNTPTFDKEKKEEVNKVLQRKTINDTISDKKNLVVVFMESLESWPIGMKIGDKEITPVLNNLTAMPNTLFYRNVVPQTGAGRSIDAQLLVLCGLLPPEDKVFSFKYVGNNYPSVYKAMKELRGSDVYSFTPDSRTVYNIGKLSGRLGIDSLYTLSQGHSHRHLPDDVLFNKSIELIETKRLWKEHEPKCFQFVTYSCHAPCRYPQDIATALPAADSLPNGLNRYIGAVHYSDHSLGILIRYLQSKSDYNQTLVVIIGDHQAFGKETRRQYSKSLKALSEPLVPLIILNAVHTDKDCYKDRHIEQVDTYTTILQTLGLANYDWHGLGRSAVEPVTTEIADKQKISELIIAYDLYKKVTNE